MGLFSKLFKAAFSKFRMNNENPLSGSELKQVLVGAVYAEQQMAYLNSYETGLPEDKADTILKNYWGIYNAADAVETLTYLQNKGHRFYFDVIFDAVTKHKTSYASFLEEQFPEKEELDKAVQLFRGLRTGIQTLIDDKVVADAEEIKKTGVEGWDYGRLSFMARLCCDRNLISTFEMKDFLTEALNSTKGKYNSWEDVGKSYVIGRSMWGGSDNSGIAVIARQLYTDAKSPWVQNPL